MKLSALRSDCILPSSALTTAPSFVVPVPLWGHYAAMLRDGGAFKGERGWWSQGYYEWPKGRGPRTRPRSVQVYDTEVVEPEPRISNLDFTAKIMTAMIRRRWSFDDVNRTMSDTTYRGGEFYRFECLRNESFGERFYQGSVEYRTQMGKFIDMGVDQQPICIQVPSGINQPLTTSSPTEKEVRGTQLKVWKTVNGFDIRERDALNLLFHLLRHGEQTMTEVQESGAVHPRVCRRLVHALADAGLVTVSTETHRCRDGKRRSARVVRVAPHNAVEASLTDPTVMSGDRVLWDALRPVSSTAAIGPDVDLDTLLRAQESNR